MILTMKMSFQWVSFRKKQRTRETWRVRRNLMRERSCRIDSLRLFTDRERSNCGKQWKSRCSYWKQRMSNLRKKLQSWSNFSLSLKFTLLMKSKRWGCKHLGLKESLKIWKSWSKVLTRIRASLKKSQIKFSKSRQTSVPMESTKQQRLTRRSRC